MIKSDPHDLGVATFPASPVDGGPPDHGNAETLSADEIEGILSALCGYVGCTRAELIVKIRERPNGQY